jgi:hypothetical protein
MKRTNHETAWRRERKVLSLLVPVEILKAFYFYTLTTGKVVVCRAWTELPTPNSVITRVHLLAKGMPVLPVFTDHTGRIIGDVINKEIYDNNEPKGMSELTNDQRLKVLQSHMFVVRKRTGETKARMVAGGNLQQGHVTKEESSSPTVSTESVLLTSIVDALEERDVAIINIPNAFTQTRVQDAKDHIIISMTGVIVDWLVNAAPKVYAKYVAVNSRGEKSLLVECFNAIYVWWQGYCTTISSPAA